ncbi:hypothetical protein KIN20_004803 [Parelaphostrongylus tenuis]|uniref:Uncharacterized protein n=1 Tax=Parelaphostrongylus tenuis TaxID=148309 RepID=A0AAD5M3N2_PARTN|nr:hypothetical protein KIN20_004803 [Parelaphostrongylus tenuis]
MIPSTNETVLYRPTPREKTTGNRLSGFIEDKFPVRVDSTMLPNCETQINRLCTFFNASEDFIEFFSGPAGKLQLRYYEDRLDINIILRPKGFAILHSPSVQVKLVEKSLWNYFHEFARCVRLSVLNAHCLASQGLLLNTIQYELLQEKKIVITRATGLTEIFDYAFHLLEVAGHAVLGAAATSTGNQFG